MFCTHLLDEFEQFVILAQTLQHLIDLEHGQHRLVHHRLLHDVPPVLVDRREATTFFRHLRHDVWRAEDGLQIQPRRLALEPLVENVLQGHKTLLPVPVERHKTKTHYKLEPDGISHLSGLLLT